MFSSVPNRSLKKQQLKLQRKSSQKSSYIENQTLISNVTHMYTLFFCFLLLIKKILTTTSMEEAALAIIFVGLDTVNNCITCFYELIPIIKDQTTIEPRLPLMM